MKNGTCPKCSQSTVYTSKGGLTYATGGAIYVQNLKSIFVMPTKEYSNYICSSCGYIETYLEDEVKLKEIASKWNKV